MNQNSTPERGWLSAYMHYLADTQESAGLKAMPLALFGFGPLDDVLLPGIGFGDDLPVAVITVIVLAKTIKRVRDHRY